MEKIYALGTNWSPVDNRDYVLEAILPSEEYVPATLDLRDRLPAIRDQGSQGTCSAQTASCMKEWQERFESSLNGYMSPQFIYNNRQNQDSSGMTPRDTMKILQKIGSVPDVMYPYGTIEHVEDIPKHIKDSAFKYRIREYASISTIEALKKALYKSGPCYIAFPVYNYGMEFWKASQGDKIIGGHAVTVVGYTKSGFIIRNSWGNLWGENGYTVYPFAQWGSHREVWTTVDEKTGAVLVPLTWWNKLVMWFKNLF